MLMRLVESGTLPDPVVRLGIRHLLRRRLREEHRRRRDAAALRTSAATPDERIAIATDRANEQHYELPPEFFELILGPRLKYSCCLWDDTTAGLAEAEEAMLELTAQRAGVRNGLTVLDLGSGWGSFGLWVAERFPGCRVTTVSNSAPQQQFIARQARARGLDNVETIRADINRFAPARRWDRIVSVEMFEHVRDHRTLLDRIARWLEADGLLFVHHFCHRELEYTYEIRDETDWMARYFFTGGVMPSFDMLARVGDPLAVERSWRVSGWHYARTLRAWLARLDASSERALDLLRGHYGAASARTWFVRWRLFLLACAELFEFRGGNEWLVAHHLLRRRGETS